MAKPNSYEGFKIPKYQARRAPLFKRIKCVALCGLVLFASEGCATLSAMRWNGGSNSGATQDETRNYVPVYTGKGQVVSPGELAGR